jgi:hypothetical protein
MTSETKDEPQGGNPLLLVGAWLVVGAPLAWGIVQTIGKALALFR